MSARFRIRTSQGQEISFASHDMFAEFVRSGDLSPDDVVYDAETHEWSSALTHPVVLQIESQTEEHVDTDASAGDGGPPDAEAAPPDPPAVDIGLELAPAPDQLSPDEQEAAFVERMEAERASDLDPDDEPQIEGLKMEQGSSGLVDGLELAEEAEPTAPRAQRRSPRRSPPLEESRGPAARADERVGEASRWGQEPPKRVKKKKGSGTLGRYAPLLIVGAVVAAAGIYFGPELLTTQVREQLEPEPDPVAIEQQAEEPSVAATEEALRERAEERFLTSTRALLRDLPTIPEAWLGGPYLAAPSEYPEVREAWNALLTLVRRVRDGDDDRYRAGFARALDDAAVEGPDRTMRLAGAVASFQDRQEARAAHYDRVEALATAALRGHDALVEAEGTIAYDPASGTPQAGDRVIDAVGRNEDAQAYLDQVLDLIRGELDEPVGPGSAANLEEWFWDGILDAVAR